ncbi:MAG: FAD-dependent oxidoreductase [Oscillospiraceae bacterium]
MKILIVGGVAGGATAAARLRRINEQAEIIVFERGGYVSYANCGLPYYIGGDITDKRALTLQSPRSFLRRFNVDVRVKQEVTAIDPEKKTVTVLNHETGETYSESYDKLLLSPGAKPTIPNLPGTEGERIFTLRTVEDTYRIKDYVSEAQVKSAVVVGGGFIGLEMAECLINAGLSVTLLQRSEHVMPNLDFDMASFVHGYMRYKGINLLRNQALKGYESKGGKVRVLRGNGDPIEADMVLLAIGVTPDTELAKKTGLKLGLKDSILVNDKMETSIPDIYAAGDAVEVINPITGKPAVIPLAGPANKQGRIAADNINGGDSRYKGSIGAAVMKLFDMTVATVGLTEKTAKLAGVDFDYCVTYSPNHATYYPGASNMTIKVLFEPKSGRLLGAQIVGFDGVDKRIDVLATAIRFKMTAYDLTELELAYAPPYSSAKDPVNMVGYIMQNVLDGRVKQYYWNEAETLPRDGSVQIVDVRTPGEYDYGHIPGAVNIPVDEMRQHMGELDKTKPVYLNCQVGMRSYIAYCILTQSGYDCYNLAGGYHFYESAATENSFREAPCHPCGVAIKE